LLLLGRTLIGAGLSAQNNGANTTAPICGTSPELHQYSNPDNTSDLTYHPDNMSFSLTHIITGQFEQNLTRDFLSPAIK